MGEISFVVPFMYMHGLLFHVLTSAGSWRFFLGPKYVGECTYSCTVRRATVVCGLCFVLSVTVCSSHSRA